MPTIVFPQGNLTPIGEELAASISATYPDEQRRIWFGANALPYPPIGNGYPEPTEEDIIYQHEPLANQPREWGEYFRRRLATVAEVWDYSVCNLGSYQAKKWRYRPPLFNRTLEFQWGSDEQDIDIGFIGQLNERRRAILGFRGDSPPPDVQCMPFGFGEERDVWASRCKVIVVPHQMAGNPVEKFRISLLLSNGIAVVAEEAPDQADYPGPMYVRASAILDTARELVRSDSWGEFGDQAGWRFSAFSLNMRNELAER